MARDRIHLMRLVAGQVEKHIWLDLSQGAGQLILVGAVAHDVARERAIRSILSPRGDGLNATTHELLAGSHADKARPAEDQRAGQISRAVNSTSIPSTLSSRAAISRAIDTERWRPPVHPNATTRCDRPRSR